MSHGRTTYADRGREDELRELLHRRVLVLDGAMGTMLQDRNLTAADFGGPSLESCNEYLVKTRSTAGGSSAKVGPGWETDFRRRRRP
jgi:hypothetical protein